MFRQLAAVSNAQMVLTGYRPSQLAEYLEAYWGTAREGARQRALGPGMNDPGNEPAHAAMARVESLDPVLDPPDPPLAPSPVGWHHLVYAYMLENTRMVDIFRRVVFEWTTGERLPLPTQATQRWLHVTEQLFFGSPWSYSIRSTTSSVRPDSGAVRRNAYYRLLGMDLNHGTDDGQIYPFVKPASANREFASVFEALLVEVWRAYANRNTAVAENLTDEEAITTLVRRLNEMLQSRRLGGSLSREEFEAVAMLSWFHLTLESDTSIVNDLSARAQGLADRLTRIGERVGLPAHARSDAYFHLAEPMSVVLLAIESGDITVPGDLYLDLSPYADEMRTIITHWSVATGRNIKDPTARQPISNVLRQMAPAGGPVGNGSGGGTGAGVGGRLGAYLK